ncbi:hypothetical protein CKO28_00085 [Rhodovibrio sodomensis]|uniref:DUF695 domain-containing protein n=1 Tax=Rhodovibrio sodomensis TaxID=1088 RepID=A0ABS1D8J1_9PROT|nr:hypothetical protein [Rhodovibrio sodomensis]MBK1666437.1 hypothetical protein [Rhodovibrio sodomensis]
MQVRLSDRKLKALAKRLEQDLSLTPNQRRRTLDALARGFGHDSYPALRAALDTPAPADLSTASDRDLVQELERRGHLVIDRAPADLDGLIDADAQPDWLATRRGRIASDIEATLQGLVDFYARQDGVCPTPVQADPQEPHLQVEYAFSFAGGDYDGVGEFRYVPLSLIQQKQGNVEIAFTAKTGIPPQHVVHVDLDTHYTASGDPIADTDDAEDAAVLRQRIARAVHDGQLRGTNPDWQVTLDDPEDPDLRALAAERIAEGKDRDDEFGAWRLDCDALDTHASDPDVVREVIAGLIREGYTSGHYPHWILHCTPDDPDADDRESLFEHIASLIEQGYTSGYHPFWRIECSLIA